MQDSRANIGNMYTLVIANKNYSSWSLRPWVLMRMLGIGFTEQLIPFGPQPPGQSITERSPSGRVPCLVDGDFIVWDSLAITEYLAERHAGVWPAGTRVRAWARCAVAEMHSGFFALRNSCGMTCGQRIRLHEHSPALRDDLSRLVALWHDGLQRHGGPFLAGSAFTAVDAFFAPVAFREQTYDLGLPAEAAAYAQRLRDLPAMQDWYAAALAEPWRDDAHEREVAACGTVTADLRRS
jgi:glutathione S-transferase